MIKNKYESLEKKINLKFKNKELLTQALTHKSFNTNENNENTFNILPVINLIVTLIILIKPEKTYFFKKSKIVETTKSINDNNVSNISSIKSNKNVIPVTIDLHKSNFSLTTGIVKGHEKLLSAFLTLPKPE